MVANFKGVRIRLGVRFGEMPHGTFLLQFCKLALEVLRLRFLKENLY